MGAVITDVSRRLHSSNFYLCYQACSGVRYSTQGADSSGTSKSTALVLMLHFHRDMLIVCREGNELW